MVGFLGDDEVREVWRMRDGHRPVLTRAAQARVDPGGGNGQMLPKTAPLRLRPLWGTSVYNQDPTHYREMQRQLREHEPQGTAISHAELLKVPRSRLHYLMRPGLVEAAEAKNQRHAAWRDDPMRLLCYEQAYRCQVRAAQSAPMPRSLPPLAARSRHMHMDSVAPGPELAEHSERMHPMRLSRRREHVMRALAAETAKPSRGRTQVRVLRPGDRTPPPAEEEEEEVVVVVAAAEGAAEGAAILAAALTTAAIDHAGSGNYGGFGSSVGAGGAGGGLGVMPPPLAAEGAAEGAATGVTFTFSSSVGVASVSEVDLSAPSAMMGQPNMYGTRPLDSSMVSLPPLGDGSVGGRAQPTLPPAR